MIILKNISIYSSQRCSLLIIVQYILYIDEIALFFNSNIKLQIKYFKYFNYSEIVWYW